MKKNAKLSFVKTFILFAILSICTAFAQVPRPALIGYFHNWDYSKAPYIPLNFIDSRYNIIEIAFASPKNGTSYDMKFKPIKLSQKDFIKQIQTLQQKKKKVLISIGGGGTLVKINTYAERDIFVNSINKIINTFGFDGIDLDLESGSINMTGGTIKHPIDSNIIYMIDAVKRIMHAYRERFGKKLILTMAPETAYVQGGQSAYGGVWGAYLPIIDALRDSIDILQTQLYNSGSMYGIDRNIYIQETADFIVAMCEAVIYGFKTNGGHFAGLPANKIAVGLPACPKAAGHGYTLPVHVRNAIKYLMGSGAKPGLYTLEKNGGYPDLLGMMTWSINWDAVSTCAESYEYAQIFENIFGTSSINNENNKTVIYPNPATDYIDIVVVGNRTLKGTVRVFDVLGSVVLSSPACSAGTPSEGGHIRLDVSGLSAGVYFVRVDGKMYKFVKL